jgi:DNA helicase II / ATP-dependent DNA helicase PcrA
VDLKFKTDDRVQYSIFGSGVVVGSKSSGTDEKVEVAFVGKGVKRLIARYAGLKKK